MPHINRVRLVNVGFNDAKSFFEDLRLSLAGKSTTYDLENGGGKSVLLMMLLQTVIPNTSLRDDKPLKNIFIGGKDRTSHVLVEWILDEGERYKYMLTGFCARRKRNQNEVRQPVLDGYNIEQDEDTISEGIDYYNYVIFYDKPVEYDIYSLELVREEQSGKIYIGYDELRSELNRLKQRGYPVNIKDGKREYMEYISMYNLISTEWKIIREMNSGENSIEKYFRENKTSRRLIEKLLLPIIDDTERVQQSGKLEGDGNIQLADTLIEIRENLARLMKDREHLEEYNQILLFYNRMLEICNRMEKDFQYEEKLKKQAVEIRNLLAKKLDEKKKEKAELEADLTEKTFNNRKTEHEKKLLDIQLLEFDEGLLKVEHEEVKAQQVRLEDERREQEDKYKTAGAEKEYLQYKEGRLNRRKAETGLKTLFQSQNELDKEYNEAGSAYRTALVHQQNELEGMSSKAAKQKEGIQLDGDCIDQKISEVSRLIGIAEGDESSTSARIAELDKKAKPLSEYFSELGRVDVLLDLSSYLDTSEKELERLEDNKKEIETALLDIRQRGQDVKSQITQNSQDIEKIKWQLTPHVEFFEKYGEEKLKLDKKSSFYDCEDFMQWRSRLVELIHGNKETYFRNRVEKDVLSRKLEVLETYGFYIPNEEILALSDKLKGNSTFTQTGIEWLNQMGKTQQEELLKRAPLLPYSVLVDHEAFQRIKDGKLDFGGFISDYPVPIIDFDFIRGQETLGRGDVIFPEIDKNLILSKDALNQYIDELKRDIKRVQESMITLEESAQTYDEDINALTVFEEDYSSEKIASHERTLKKLEDEILNLENKGKSLTDQLNELQKFEKDLSTRIARNEKKYHQLIALRTKASDLHEFNLELDDKKRALEEAKRAKADLKEKFAEFSRQKQSIRQKRDEIDELILSLKLELSQCRAQLTRAASFELLKDVMPTDLETSRSEFDALDEQMKGRSRQEEDLRNQINLHENMMKKCADNMQEHYGFTVEIMAEREASGHVITHPDENYIRSIRKNIKTLDEEISKKQEALSSIDNKISRLGGIMDEKRKELDYEFSIQMEKFRYRYEIEKAIEDANQILLLYQDEITNLNTELEALGGKISKFQSELERYQEFIQKEDISFYTEDLAKEILEYGKYSNSYYSHVNRFKDWEQNWRRTLRSIEGESEKFYIKDPITQLSGLEIPTNLRDCTLMIRQMTESIDMISERIDKTLEDIMVLQNYQQEFVRRCIQRADHALDLLKKLPALSRIDIEGRKTNMIRMDFTDFDEKEKEMRMENHIQSIIREISEENIKDRMYIAERLSTKELLAQITNMEKATVRLYKVERIQEHSRYLKWEHAVGSEGQSNALYFIFAVCLISYIRMLTSINVSVRTKKVIIADNPFGATSAVYLWEPMFNILRSNDVQLIAPGHNIPRELTAQFEVNYLLNQDILANSRTRVVVKDVRTEEDLEQLNFNKLEQLSLI